MEYNRGNIDKLFHEIVQAKEIAIEEIPCIDLYMDQVTTFFEDKLSKFLKDSSEKQDQLKTREGRKGPGQKYKGRSMDL